MLNCPECKNGLDYEPDDLERGDYIDCYECGASYKVVRLKPLKLLPVDDEGEPLELSDNDEPGIQTEYNQSSAFAEVTELGRAIPKEGWRKADPTMSEIALGYAAFYYWLVGGEELSGDPHHYSFPSESTRIISQMIIGLTIELPQLANAVRRQNPRFDARREIGLISLKLPRDHPAWGECVTRFVIMFCRTLACAALGQVGELRHVDPRNPQACRELGEAIALAVWDVDVVRSLYAKS